ncbi:hypothetical protein EI534_13750 [Pseudomonas frederiksbergensis]|nr:hypothetical protein [Pseudomonas frederiksbergensis]
MARELAPARLRSSRKTGARGVSEDSVIAGFGAASQPSGSKLPRHNSMFGFIFSNHSCATPRHILSISLPPSKPPPPNP